MNSVSTVVLARDCDAVQIPAGNVVTIPAGTEVDITQTLGGSYTIHALGGLFRVGPKDADALGITPSPETAPASSSGHTDEKAVWEMLRTCYDPEIPVNIVDLGLVYSLDMKRTDGGGKRVEVKMTLTAQGCGMGPSIAADARQKILSLEGIQEAQVDVVWDPPWGPQMITPDGRKKLGMD